MKGIGRILIIVLVVLAVAYGGSLLALPSTASKTQGFDVTHSPASVFTHLASAPANTPIGQGIVQTSVQSAANNVVVAGVKYPDGVGGKVTYTVRPTADGAHVDVKLERDLGFNPLDRIQGMNGAPVAAPAAIAFPAIGSDLTNPAIEGTSYDGLAYEIINVPARPFLFNANCSPIDPKEIKEAVAQSLAVLEPLMTRYHLTQDGAPIAVETAWDTPEHPHQYCFEIGYAFTGTPPHIYAGGQVGQTPTGQAMRVHFTGAEENVLPTYDKMELAIWSAHLQHGRSFEVYYDDAEQNGGSVNRDIYYLIPGDASALTHYVPSAGPVPPVGAAATPAPATTTATTTATATITTP